MAHIRKVGKDWYILEGRKGAKLPPDMAAKLEKGEFKFGDYVADVKPLGQAEKLEQFQENVWEHASALSKKHPELAAEIKQAKKEFIQRNFYPLLDLVAKWQDK